MNNQQEKTSLINQFLLLFNDKNNTQIKQRKQYTPDKSTNYQSCSDYTKITQISPLENKYKQENNNKILITNNIKYGIDENGNPINIKEYYKSINDSVILNSNTSIFSGITNSTSKLKKPIAYITKDENNNNILIDLKGNKITSKNKDGDYDFPLELHVIIKDFDVKHPELRVNGERYYKDDINEKIDITKEINEKENKFDENINNNYKNENYTLNEELYINNIKQNLLTRKNTNNYFENKVFTKYNNSINFYGSNDNNVITRTSDILNNSNSLLTPNYIKNSPKQINNYSNNPEKKFINKNRIFMSPILRSNTSNLISLKCKKDLSNNQKMDNELRNRIQAIKCSLSINNIKSKLITKNKENINNKEYKYRSKKNKSILNQKLYTETYTNKKLEKYICPNIMKPKEMNIQKKLNRNLNNHKYIFGSPDRSERNNIYKTQFQKYFLVQHNKSFTNSQLNKKKEEKMNKTIKKKSIIIPINNKTNNNLILDLEKNSKDNNNIKKKSINSSRNKVQNRKRKVENKDLTNKMKKIPSKRSIENIQKNKPNKLINQEKNKYYILSEEANDMIKSFSNRKGNNEKNLNKNNESAECSKKCKPSIYRYQKLINNENKQINFNNSYFSYINKNNLKNKEEKERISDIQSLDNINKKYLGITVSLPNNKNSKNNKNKTLKTSTNNQININFTPYQIQCESLIKNNADTNAQYNHFIKKNINGFKGKNKFRIKKNCISPNYEIYL